MKTGLDELHERLKRPVLALADTTRRLGQWTRATRTLELSRALLNDEHAPLFLSRLLELDSPFPCADEWLEPRIERAA